MACLRLVFFGLCCLGGLLVCQLGWAQGFAFVLSATPQNNVQYGPITLGSTPNVAAKKIDVKKIPVVQAVLPTQTLRPGQMIHLRRGARLSVAIMAPNQTPHRRVYLGPARLHIKADYIAVLAGSKPQVSPLSDQALELIMQWQEWQQNKHQPQTGTSMVASGSGLVLVEPQLGEVLLHRHPVLVWQGALPREANLVLFDGQGKRFWSQALEEPTVEFPHTLEFEWGHGYRLEVRKATGGRIFESQFEIASEATAKDLLAERANNLAQALPEWRLLYAMRLHLAKAYSQARPVWQSLGLATPAYR